MSTAKSLLLLVAVIAAASPVVAQTAPYSYAPRGDTEFGPLLSPGLSSGHTRAEVRAELLSARKEGTVIPASDALPYPEAIKGGPDLRSMGAAPAPVRRAWGAYRSTITDQDPFVNAP